MPMKEKCWNFGKKAVMPTRSGVMLGEAVCCYTTGLVTPSLLGAKSAVATTLSSIGSGIGGPIAAAACGFTFFCAGNYIQKSCAEQGEDSPADQQRRDRPRERTMEREERESDSDTAGAERKALLSSSGSK